MRQKVVEEGWFGRVVTAAPVVEVDRALTQDAAASLYGDDHSPLKSGPTPAVRPSFEELWAPREASPADIAQERGIDIDR